MNLLIDTNILLDVLQKREPHFRYSSLIWKLCETGKARGFVSALSIANILYVLKKRIPQDKVSFMLSKLSLIFHIVPLTYVELHAAAQMNWKDYEDAVQLVTAENNNASYLITRNKKDYTETVKVRVMTPEEFIWILRSFEIGRYLHDNPVTAK